MTKLRDICRFQSGGTPSRGTPAYFNGNVPWITTVALNGDVIDGNQAIEWITDEAIAKSAAKIVPPHSVMVGTRVGIGKVAINSVPMSTSQDIISLIGIDENKWDKKFICHLITANKEHLTSQARGATIKGIKIEAIADLVLPEISLKEQARISEVIGKVDALMHMHQQMAMNLEQLIKSRFIELFGDQTANPYAWQQTSIGACCTLKSGTSLPADRENEGGAIPYVKVGDMNYPGNEQYITTSSRFVSEQTAGTGVFPVGTVVFPKRGGAIGTNKKRLTRIPICADLNVMGVTAGRRLTPQYLMAYFNTVDLGTLNNGSSVPQINNKDIVPLLICIPPMALQEQFAAFVEQTDKSKLCGKMEVAA